MVLPGISSEQSFPPKEALQIHPFFKSLQAIAWSLQDVAGSVQTNGPHLLLTKLAPPGHELHSSPLQSLKMRRAGFLKI